LPSLVVALDDGEGEVEEPGLGEAERLARAGGTEKGSLPEKTGESDGVGVTTGGGV